jgi:sugar lactone lactonase YvrE
MPLEPRAASYFTEIVKASVQANVSLTGTVSNGNSTRLLSNGTLRTISSANIFEKIRLRDFDMAPGPPGDAGPPGPDAIIELTAINGILWGDSPPSTAEEAINRIAAYLYLRTLNYGPIPLFPPETTTLELATSVGTDVFVAKYNTDGNPQWVRRIASTAADFGTAVTSDSNGNVYVAGSGAGIVKVFAADAETIQLDLLRGGPFVVKYNTNGDFQWARSLLTIAGVQSMITDSSGDLYLCGNYTGTTTDFVSNDTGSNLSLRQSYGYDGFVAKIDKDGQGQWVRAVGAGQDNESLNDLDLDSDGNVYVVGNYRGGSAQVYKEDNTVAFTLTNLGDNDMIVIKYDTTGDPKWARRIGGTGSDIGNGISVDSGANVYTTGTPNFLIKYNSSEVEQWRREVGGNKTGIDTAVDSDDNIYVSAFGFSAATILNENGSTAFTLGNSGSHHAIIVKYNSDGTPQWGRRIDGTLSDQPLDMSVDPDGNLYVSGFNSAAAQVYAANDSSVAFTIGHMGSVDGFVVKYSPDGTPKWARRLATFSNVYTNGISTDSSGNVYVGGTYGGKLTLFPSS